MSYLPCHEQMFKEESLLKLTGKLLNSILENFCNYLVPEMDYGIVGWMDRCNIRSI